MSSKMLQQHQQVTRKRHRDLEEEYDGTGKRQKVACEDGSEIIIVTVQEKQSQAEAGSWTIQSIALSGRIGSDGIDGKLLRAGSGENPEEITVDFSGTDPDDPTSEFYLERNDNVEGNILRYSWKDHNYYLAVETFGEVILRKLDHPPTITEVAYFFDIQRIGHEVDSPVTFKSLKTGEYLHCIDGGKAFMNKITASGNGEPKNRQTWFSLKRNKQTHQQILQLEEEHILWSPNNTYIEVKEEQFIANDIEDEKSEDAGEANWEEAGKILSQRLTERNSENLFKGNAEDVEEENMGPQSGEKYSDHTRKGNFKCPNENNSEYLLKENAEVVEAPNSEPQLGEKYSDHTRKENSKCLGEEDFDDLVKENAEGVKEETSEPQSGEKYSDRTRKGNFK